MSTSGLVSSLTERSQNWGAPLPCRGACVKDSVRLLAWAETRSQEGGAVLGTWRAMVQGSSWSRTGWVLSTCELCWDFGVAFLPQAQWSGHEVDEITGFLNQGTGHQWYERDQLALQNIPVWAPGPQVQCS